MIVASLATATALAGIWHAERAIASPSSHDQAAVTACLRRLQLPYLSLHGRELGKPLTEFRGLSGSILITSAPSASDPGAKATIDTVQLFFFENSSRARQAQSGLAQLYVFFHPPFAYLRALRPVPPDAAALRSIERVDRNVDIFWNYPRHRPAVSDQTLARCLTAR
jgi:hypothetical protein